MKKAAGLISLILIIGTALAGCAGGGSPSSVVRQLHTAIEQGDNKTITDLTVSEAAGVIIKMMQTLQQTYADTGGIAKTEQTINGDTASVKVTYKNGDSDNYDLIKVDGKWKVTVKMNK